MQELLSYCVFNAKCNRVERDRSRVKRFLTVNVKIYNIVNSHTEFKNCISKLQTIMFSVKFTRKKKRISELNQLLSHNLLDVAYSTHSDRYLNDH